jgi:hypothetical protein
LKSTHGRGFPPLTDREPLQILEPTGSVAGVDRLAVTFPLRSWEDRPGRWDEEKVRHGERSWSSYLPLGERCGVHVVAFESAGPARWYGRVDGNPARFVDPDGVGTCPPERAYEVGVAMVGVARELLEPAAMADEWNVTRLDVARDFTVARPDFYVRGLQYHPRPWARRSFVHHDPSRGGAQTLCVGSNAGTVRLYDKHEENPRLAPPGTLRWETEAHKGWLSGYGDVRKLRDVHEATVASLASNRWQWSAMGAEIAAADRVVERLLTANVGPAVAHGFLGWAVMQSVGVAIPMSHTTLAKYRKLQRELGVALEPGAMAGSFVGRLDFETGREVLRVA